MAGPIGKSSSGDEQVSWASRSDSQHTYSPAASHSSSIMGRGSQVNESIHKENDNESDNERKDNMGLLLSPSEHRFADSSPQPITDHEVGEYREQDRYLPVRLPVFSSALFCRLIRMPLPFAAYRLLMSRV